MIVNWNESPPARGERSHPPSPHERRPDEPLSLPFPYFGDSGLLALLNDELLIDGRVFNDGYVPIGMPNMNPRHFCCVSQAKEQGW